MPPFLSLRCAGGFRSLHSLFRIYTEDHPHRHLVAIRQLHNYVRDFPGIAFPTPFEASQYIFRNEPTVASYSGSRSGAS